MEQQDLSLVGETQLVVVVKLEGNDMYYEELMVLDNYFESSKHFDIVMNDEVLHRVVTVVKESTFIDQVMKVVVDIEEDCIKNDGCSGKTVREDSY
ncbi:hypothetical protein Tco_1482239 [Tanacetum coccineum]